MHPTRLPLFLALSAVILPAFAGCVDTLTPASVTTSPNEPTLTLDLPIHVITVGFPSFDEAALRAHLVQPPVMFVEQQLTTTALLKPEPLQYRVSYEVHAASASFARALFAYAQSIAEPSPPDAWLAQHDREGLQRICKPGALPPAPAGLPVSDPTVQACRDVQRIDALAIEAWIEEHRDEAGLRWPAPGYAVFLLDSWDTEGLPKDTYHQYVVKDNQTTRGKMDTLRAWGGASDFVFLDVGAAPNAYDYKPWANMTNWYSEVELADLTDPPIYEVKDNATFYENLGRDISDAVHILWARPPLYRFEYADEYHIPVTVFIDPQAHANPESILSKISPLDYEKHTDQAAFQRAFQDLVPWAKVSASFNFVMLPEGDEGMREAIQDAKSRYGPQALDFGIIKHYVHDHWTEYVPEAAQNVRVYPTFAFVLEAPSQYVYAFADGDEVGNSFGVFVNIQDTLTCGHPPFACNTADRFGTEAAWWEWWNGVLAHEGGHSFGLTHSHDTGSPDEKGFFSYNVNWLWDSTSSVMGYRHKFLQFNRFDQDQVMRGNAVELARQVLTTPTASRAAHDEARDALGLIRAGDYRGAVDVARAAHREAGATLPSILQGTPGKTETLELEVPAALSRPVGLPVALPNLPLPEAGVSVVDFPIKVPAGAKGILLEYFEKDAPSHAGWSASVYVTNAENDVVVRMTNNAHDRVALLGLHHCEGACTGHLVVDSGVATRYTIQQTPYL